MLEAPLMVRDALPAVGDPSAATRSRRLARQPLRVVDDVGGQAQFVCSLLAARPSGRWATMTKTTIPVYALSLSLVSIASIATLPAQSPEEGGPPKVLQIIREEVKPGKEAAHMKV